MMSLRHERLAERLRAGAYVRHSESGNSMLPLIQSREEVLLASMDTSLLEVGDIVFAKVAGRFFLHRVSALQGNRVQIANHRGRVNGWTTRDRVYGIVVEIGGRTLPGVHAKIRRIEQQGTENIGPVSISETLFLAIISKTRYNGTIL